MLREKVLIPVFMLFILVTPVFASVDLIEEDIGDYKYISTRMTDWNPIVSGKNVSYPVYNLKYNGSEGQFIYAQVIEFTDDQFGKDYLSNFISQKIKEGQNQYLLINNNYTFKHTRGKEGLIWSHNNVFVCIFFDNYSNLPDEILESYLNLYPSDCDSDGCVLGGGTMEGFCDRLFWNKALHSGDVYRKHNGFTIWCKGKITYGREGEVTKPDLTFEQFKEEINRKLFTEMNFTEEEIKQNYQVCVEEGYYRFEGFPLEGFLKECHDKVYPIIGNKIEKDEETCKTWRDAGEDHISCYGFEGVDFSSIRVCESVRLTIKENKDLIEKQKEKFGDELIDGLIDWRVKKELERKEKDRRACEEWEEGDEPIAGCDKPEKEEEGEASVVSIVGLCEEWEEGDEPIAGCDKPEKEEVDEESVRVSVVELVITKIISFFKSIF